MSFLDSLVVAIGLAVVLPLGLLILTMSHQVLMISLGRASDGDKVERPHPVNAVLIVIQFVLALALFVWLSSHIFKMVSGYIF